MYNNYGHWISLSEQFLKTSKLIIEQIIQSKNKWVVLDDKPIELENYFELTKWSDFNTLVPSIFLLMHGLELLVKGLVAFCDGVIKYDHKISDMISFLYNDPRIDNDLITTLEIYIGLSPSNALVKEFLRINKNIKSNNIHVDIRYPEKGNSQTDFSSFRYKGEPLIKELSSIISDIDKIYSKTLKIIRTS